jgi:DNA-directed RNA polymerase subunit RPC12/RpoP
MKQTKKMRTRYGHTLCLWGRKECADWVQSKKCPQCGTKRLFPGPDYDRFRIFCMECGYRAAIKPPKEALRARSTSG